MSHDVHHHPHSSSEHAGPHDHDHGHGHEHEHQHYIIPMRKLLTVLGILLLFTGLTVVAANAEILWMKAFDVVLPQWVNVAVALSIAAVKSIIVAAYFMQLRYDAPFNSLIAVFTIIVLTFFLGFTMIDLGSRKALYDYKGTPIVEGGTGGMTKFIGYTMDPSGRDYKRNPETGEPIAITESIVGPIVLHARDKADRQIDQMLAEGKKIESKVLKKRLAIRYQGMKDNPALAEANKEAFVKMAEYVKKNPAIMSFGHSSHHGSASSHESHTSTPDASRPGHGITLPELMDAKKPGSPAEGHGSSH
jgi:cytochrome c oxidase subunit IV